VISLGIALLIALATAIVFRDASRAGARLNNRRDHCGRRK
jgi:hypothetical protein